MTEHTRFWWFCVQGKIPAKSSGRRIVRPKGKDYMRVVSSPQTLKYERDFLLQVQHAVPMTKKDDRLDVVLLVLDTSRRQDLDSYPKIILDCLQKATIIPNDNRVDHLEVVRLIDKDEPRVYIGIRTIEGEESWIYRAAQLKQFLKSLKRNKS
jgi:Holliday junction resolvase RusA-like endonuclease